MVRVSTTAKFGVSTLTVPDIGVFTNDEACILGTTVTSGATSFAVDDATAFPVGMWLSLRNGNGLEVVQVTAVDLLLNTITVGRAKDGTTAVAHTQGEALKATIPAVALNQMASELVALEAFLNGGIYTPGSVVFIDASSHFGQDNTNFYYDDSTNQLKLGGQGSAAGLLIGTDTQLYRGAANRLELATGDTFRLESLQVKGSPWFDVKAYGAVGDGVTDDTTAIQAAEDAAAVAGGVVLFPIGTFLAQTLTKKSGTYWRGAGVNKTILKLKTGTNADLVKGDNFAALTGTASTSGISDWGISDMTLDGNKAGNTAGYGLRVFGLRFFLNNIHIRNAKEDGFYSEYGGTNSPAIFAAGSFENRVSNFKVYYNDGNGITVKGPTDSHFSYGDVYLNGAIGVQVKVGSAGSMFNHIHVWGWGGGSGGTGHTVGWQLETPVYLNWCESEGATVQVKLLASDCIISGGKYFFAAGGPSQDGIQVGEGGTASGNNIITGVDVRDMTNWAVNLANNNGENIISMKYRSATGVAVNGSFQTSDWVEAHTSGGATGDVRRLTGVQNVWGGTGTPTSGITHTLYGQNQNDGYYMSHGGFFARLAINATAGFLNPLVQAGDRYYLYGEAAADAGTKGFLIAPWSASSKGTRWDQDGHILQSGNIGLSGSLTFGGDVVLSRGAANRLDLASGDSFRLASDDTIAGLQFGSAGDISLVRTAATSLRMKGSGASSLFIEATTTPATADEAQLNLVSGDDFLRLFYRDSDNNFGILHAIGGVSATKFRIDGSSNMRLLETGVGTGVVIGATSPSYRLDVAGDVRIRSANFLRFGGTVGDDDVQLYRSAADTLGLPSGDSLAVLTDGSTGALKFGATADVAVYRGAADRLDVATGDSLNIVAGNLLIGASFTYTNSSGQLALAITGSAGGLLIGADAQIFRGAANRFDLASGDSLNLVSGFVSIASDVFIDRQAPVTNKYIHIGAASAGTTGVWIDTTTPGIVLKDAAGTPHYWRITIDTTGALVSTDLGTALP